MTKIDAFKLVSAGALRGFCDVALPSGMRLHQCGVFSKDGRTWVSPPARQMIGRDGTALRTTDGKPRYEPVVSFVDRATQERWSDLVIEALREAHPEALA